LTLYAETSAVLRCLLGEPGAEAVWARLRAADRVVSSHLTIMECERALVRVATAIPLPVRGRAAVRARLAEVASIWTLVEIDAAIRARAGQPFPVEPLRTLDAIHLATVLALLPTVGTLEVLSVDARIVANARALGIGVLP